MILGLTPFGTEPVGGDVLHDSPTVTVTAPTGTVSTGGPAVPSTWTYGQAQGDVQEWYRVTVTNDAGDTQYHDSGWVESADAAYDIDVGQSPGVPGDSSDVTVHVYVRGPEEIGVGEVARYEATDGEAIIVALGDPHVTIVEPLDDSVHVDPAEVFVDWTFTDDVGGKVQEYYRVRILSAQTGAVLTTTGWVQSTDTEVTVPWISSDGSRLIVEVQAKNDEGILSD